MVFLPEELSLALQRGGVLMDSQMALYNCLFFFFKAAFFKCRVHLVGKEFVATCVFSSGAVL